METRHRSGITLDVVPRFVDIATDALAAAREEIDALNVYPVPDGDTGTNMFLTVSAARDALREASGADPDLRLERRRSRVLARGALLGARGNSGVILSQMLGASSPTWPRRDADERNAAPSSPTRCGGPPTPLRRGRHARSRARCSPSPGPPPTPRSRAPTRPGARARDVFTAAAPPPGRRWPARPTSSRRWPTRASSTPAAAASRGPRRRRDRRHRPPPDAVAAPIGTHRIPVPTAVPSDDLTQDGPAYEVMYLLDADDERDRRAARRRSAALGDSLVVVGGDGLWNVHVHVDDVGAAIEAGIEAGRPYRVRVTHFAEQVAERPAAAPRPHRPQVVAVAAGPGLAALFEEAGAVVVAGRTRPASLDRPAPRRHPRLRRGRGRRPAQRRRLGAVAEIAARTAEDERRRPGRGDPDPGPGPGARRARRPRARPHASTQDVREMTATARHARHGAVTVAAKQAITMAGPCEPGDVLGVIAGDFAVVGARPRHASRPTSSSGCSAVAASWSRSSSGEGGADLAERCAAVRRGAPPRRRRRGLRRRASRATRCWSASSESEARRDHPGRRRSPASSARSPQEAQARRGGPRHRHGRRPAAPLPAPLRRDRPSSPRSVTPVDGELLSVVGEVSSCESASRPDRATASAVPHRGRIRTDGPDFSLSLLQPLRRARPTGTSAEMRAGSRGALHRQGQAFQRQLAARAAPPADVRRRRRGRRGPAASCCRSTR